MARAKTTRASREGEDLESFFRTCELNDTERTVFLALFTGGPAPASNLAKVTGLKRPTVYAALDGLDSRGLVSSVKRKGTTQYRLIPLDQISRTLETRARQRYEQVQQASAGLVQKLGELERKQRVRFGAYDVTVIESLEGIYAHLASMLESGDFSAIFNPQTAAAGEGKAVVEEFLQRTAKSRPRIRELAVPGPAAEWYRKSIRNKRHEVKLLPKGASLTSDIIVGSNAVLICHYEAKRDLGIRIEHEEFARSMREVFELLWRANREK